MPGTPAGRETSQDKDKTPTRLGLDPRPVIPSVSGRGMASLGTVEDGIGKTFQVGMAMEMLHRA